MSNSNPSSSSSNLASCAVATLFIVILIIAAVTVYLTVFRPRDPEIFVTNVKVPSFTIVNSSVSFTFSQLSTVRNPNRAAFSHYNNIIQLFYYGNRIGYTFVPAGEIQSGQTKRMSADFSVQSFPLAAGSASRISTADSGSGYGAGLVDNRSGSTVEIESKLKMAGRVRVLGLFTHRVEAKCNCRIAISTSNGSIVAVRC